MSNHHSETWAVFADDSERMMQGIEDCLLALESDPRDLSHLDTLFRELHTLKGSAGLLGLVAVGVLTHAAEDVVDRARSGDLRLTPEMIDALLESLDLLRIVVTQSEEGAVDAHLAVVTPMCNRLRDHAGRGHTLAPVVEDLPRSMTPSEAVEAIDDLRAKLELEPTAGSRLEVAASAQLRILRFASQALGVDEFTDAFGRLEHSLQRDAPRITWFWTRVASEVVHAIHESGAVLFDQAPVSPGAEDPGMVKTFIAAMTELAREVGAQPRMTSDPYERRRSLVDRVDEARAACATMKLDEHAEDFGQLYLLLENETPDLDHVGDALRLPWTRLVEVQTRWEEMTGLAMGTGDDLRAALRDLVGPARSAASVESSMESRTNGQQEPTEREPEGSRRSMQSNSNLESNMSARAKAPSGSKFLRIEPLKVESLMTLTAEIGLAIGSVLNLAALREQDNEDVRVSIDRVEVLIRELQDSSASLGLVPVSTVFDRMYRLIRDLGVQTSKKLHLRVEGGETEIDRILVDALNDPLIHLIRNAADHGIEDPGARAATGKAEHAVIRISARQRGDSVLISIADDGRGLDREAILARATARGLVESRRVDDMSDRQVWSLVFEPGFSTATKVTGISGRGIGMDVVKTTIQSFGGRVDIQSHAGKGTIVTIQLPLTLAFMDGMVVRVGGVEYVIPVSVVLRVLRIESEDLVHLDTEDVDLIRVDKKLVPALCLEDFFGKGRRRPEMVGRLAVLIRASSGDFALPIDDLVGNEQVTMKPLLGHLRHIRGAAGCGLLRNGRVAIALNCEQLHEWTHACVA